MQNSPSDVGFGLVHVRVLFMIPFSFSSILHSILSLDKHCSAFQFVQPPSTARKDCFFYYEISAPLIRLKCHLFPINDFRKFYLGIDWCYILGSRYLKTLQRYSYLHHIGVKGCHIGVFWLEFHHHKMQSKFPSCSTLPMLPELCPKISTLRAKILHRP